MATRIGGIKTLRIDGEVFFAKGDWSIQLGGDKNDAVVGAETIHGYMGVPQIPSFEGVMTKVGSILVSNLIELTDVSVQLDAGDGTSYLGVNMWWAGEGTVTTAEGEIAARFESRQRIEEVPAL